LPMMDGWMDGWMEGGSTDDGNFDRPWG
jgi:hypothetical protein